jgi:hypothetical protein
LQAVCEALVAEVDKLEFPAGAIRPGQPAEAEYHLARDPASGRDSLVGVWRDVRGHACGTLLIHADGSFFAEYDIFREHPRDVRWFVEAVTAWGRGEIIRSEPRLLPVVGRCDRYGG